MKAPTTRFPPAPPRHLVLPNPEYREWVERFASALCFEAEHLASPAGNFCADCERAARDYGHATAAPSRPA